MTEQVFGRVVSIAIKTAEGGPMRETTEGIGVADRTLEGSHHSTSDRGLTLLSAPQWAQVQRELDGDMPWHTRRANVLIDAESLQALVGRTVRIGELEMHVLEESRPCGLMEKAQPGLLKALSRECRGGVVGRITRGGAVRVGDEVRIEGE